MEDIRRKEFIAQLKLNKSEFAVNDDDNVGLLGVDDDLILSKENKESLVISIRAMSLNLVEMVQICTELMNEDMTIIFPDEEELFYQQVYFVLFLIYSHKYKLDDEKNKATRIMLDCLLSMLYHKKKYKACVEKFNSLYKSKQISQISLAEQKRRITMIINQSLKKKKLITKNDENTDECFSKQMTTDEQNPSMVFSSEQERNHTQGKKLKEIADTFHISETKAHHLMFFMNLSNIIQSNIGNTNDLHFRDIRRSKMSVGSNQKQMIDSYIIEFTYPVLVNLELTESKSDIGEFITVSPFDRDNIIEQIIKNIKIKYDHSINELDEDNIYKNVSVCSRKNGYSVCNMLSCGIITEENKKKFKQPTLALISNLHIGVVNDRKKLRIKLYPDINTLCNFVQKIDDVDEILFQRMVDYNEQR